jgi:hypothetical protein
LPETGIPIWKIARIRMLFDDMLPDPFAVATWIEKSFTTAGRWGGGDVSFSSRTTLTDDSFGVARYGSSVKGILQIQSVG